jgi:hypothetical protein
MFSSAFGIYAPLFSSLGFQRSELFFCISDLSHQRSSAQISGKGFAFSDQPITRDYPITRSFSPHPAFFRLLLQTKHFLDSTLA